MDFPHLTGSTPFPFNEDPPAPYQTYQNTFDYTRWATGTVVKLLYAPWDGVNDVVDFEDDAARDAWIAYQPGTTYTLQAPARLMGRTIKLPLPPDVSAAYNFAVVTYPEEPVEGEDAAPGIRTWCYFVESIDTLAPSTVELTLTVDWWTTCRRRVEIPSVQLTQGHWAVANSATPDTFLKDPLEHTENLMDAEPDQLAAGRQINTLIRDAWNTGDQMAVLNVGAVNPGGDFTGGTVPSVSTGVHAFGGAPGGQLIALTTSDLNGFLNAMGAGFILNIRALWIIPRRFLTLQDAGTLHGYQVYTPTAPTEQEQSLTLTTGSFNYPTRAAGWTKLYTGQYARIRVQRSDGTMVEIPVEQLGYSAALHARLDVNDTSARILTYLAGSGAEGDAYTYTVKSLTSLPAETGGAWQATLHAAQIPTYAVYLSAAESSAWLKSFERANRRAAALTAKTNADASADTGKTNADASADTGKSNADASADTAKANTTRTTDNSVETTSLQTQLSKARQLVNNAYALNVTENNASTQARMLGITVTADQLHGGGLGTYDSSLTGSTLQTLSANAQADWENQAAIYALNAAQLTNPTTFISQAINGAAGVAAAGVSTAGKEAATTGDVAMAGAASALGAGVNLITTAVNLGVQISNSQAMQDQQRSYQVGDGVAYYFGGKTGIAYRNMLYQNQQQRLSAWWQATESRAVSLALTDAEIAYDGISVPNGGELGTQTQITANAKTTADANASATQSTAKANATRTRDTAKANATRTRDTAKANAQRAYTQALADVTAEINTSAAQPSVQAAGSSGSGWTVTPEGVEIQVSRPVDGDLLRVADRFNRLGYTCSRLIPSPTLTVMPKWSYWRCARATVRPGASGAPRQAVTAIRQALEAGVTVWKNPEEIGDIEQ